MPIEFRCPQCQKLLRVGDDAAGKQAKCPSCAALVSVPSPAAPTAAAPPPVDEYGLEPPPPPPPSGSPFASGGANPFGAPAMPQQRPAMASDNPYAAPLSNAQNPYASPLTGGAIQPSQISVNGVFETMWPVFKANMGMLIAVFFVEWLITQVFNYGGAFTFIGMQAGGVDPMFVGILQIVHGIANSVITIWLASGRDIFYMETAKGFSPPFSRLFAGHVLLWKRFLFSLLAGLAAVVVFAPAFVVGFGVAAASDEEAGLVAGFATGAVCVIPWIWIAYTYGQAWYVYVDQPVGVIEGIRISGRITPGNRLSLFAIGILGGLLVLAGLCAFLVGMFFTGPMFYLAMIIAYMQMTGQPIRGYDATVPPHMTV